MAVYTTDKVSKEVVRAYGTSLKFALKNLDDFDFKERFEKEIKRAIEENDWISLLWIGDQVQFFSFEKKVKFLEEEVKELREDVNRLIENCKSE